MAFELRRNESVRVGVRRIASERIARAIKVTRRAAGPDAPREGVDAAVHEARKRCKELRALVRLVRPGFPGYDAENAAFRDAARLLGELRDARTLLDAFDAVVEGAGGAFAGIREMLVDDARAEREDAPALLAEFAQRMEAAGDRVEHWTLEAPGFDALRGGLERTYGRCRSAMDDARAEPTTERLHDWRKRVKDTRHHLRLVRGVWTPVIEPLRQEAGRLGDLLGEEHDLAVLEAAVRERAGDHERSGELLALIDARRGDLRGRAFTLGRTLYALSPRAYGHHAKELWRAWR
jgi:CHAD domain-containing protein